MKEDVIASGWVVTPWRRYRLGWSRVILQVEEKRKVALVKDDEVIGFGRWEKRWRDARAEDMTADDRSPFLTASAQKNI